MTIPQKPSFYKQVYPKNKNIFIKGIKPYWNNNYQILQKKIDEFYTNYIKRRFWIVFRL